MIITWSAMEQFAKRERTLPLGCTLQYEFRPSLRWYPNIHSVHEFWKRQSTECFWDLSENEKGKVEEAYKQALYKIFTARRFTDCLWQRFTLTSHNNGNTIILQMDNQGRVSQLREVEKTETYKTLEVVV